MKPLTDRQQRYAAARAQGLTPTASARQAGYSAPTAKNAAAKLERHAGVRAAIGEARVAAQEQPERTIEYQTAEQYLCDVVAGAAPPDPVRVSAARALIQYQQPRQRRPLPPTHTPTAQRVRDESAVECEAAAAWAETVARVKARLRSRTE